MADGLKQFMTGLNDGSRGQRDHPDRDPPEKPKRELTERERERLKRQHWDWLKFIALCAFIGGTLGVVTVLGVVRFDVNGIGSMIANSPNRLGYTALLTASFASTFAAIAMGIGIMVRSTLPERD